MVLKFSPEALAVLDELLAEPTAGELLDRLNGQLDIIEEDPADPRVRRRRFTDLPTWCVIVRTSTEDWAILWQLNDDDEPVVTHLGPVPF